MSAQAPSDETEKLTKVGSGLFGAKTLVSHADETAETNTLISAG
jgi:hypothetical protein